MEDPSFSVGRLVIGNLPFKISEFYSLPPEDDIKKLSDDPSNSVTGHTKIKSKIFEDRFFTLYFEGGNAFPYSDTVYDSSEDKDVDNPKTRTQIERNKQTFVLVDSETQKIFLSDYGKKKKVSDYLSKKLEKETEIKSIIDKENFIKEIKGIKKINFAASPNLFTAEGVLGEMLTKDIHNLGPGIETIGLSIQLEEDGLLENRIRFVKKLFKQQDNMLIEKLEVCGRSDEKFERFFNTGTIIDKIEVNVDSDKNRMLEPNMVFTALIEKIKS